MSPDLTGTVEFDYSRQDGVISIGVGDRRFDLTFSNCSDACIYVYRSGNVGRIARVSGVSAGRTMSMDSFDSSSRVYRIGLGERVILANNGGYFAQIKIAHIEAVSHGDARDLVVFEYQINNEPDGSFVAM